MAFQENNHKEHYHTDVRASDMPTSIDSWWRTQSATMALLKHAHSQVENAESRIMALEKRIRDLEELASTDPLTGLMNRRGFEQFYTLEKSHIQRGNSKGALLLVIDLDRFKLVNDSFGHAAGDDCLKVAAATLLKTIRISDGAARLGGDEFVVMLTHTEADKAALCAHKIRSRLDQMTATWGGQKLEFGASVGITPVTSEPIDYFHQADVSLYEEKTRRKAQRAFSS